MTTADAQQQEVLIVTGMSGAGRSTAANALEDIGWYVVDNLPPQMLRPLVDLGERAGSQLPKLAAVVDVRGHRFFDDLLDIIKELRERTRLRVVFLEATDAALVHRFEAVRRPHPLQGEGTLLDGIEAERLRLRDLRETSDLVIDTSNLNIHQLVSSIREYFAEEDTPGVSVTVISFGFKYGVPADADTVADGRFLPNPFWVPKLREKTGLDQDVKDYVLDQEGAQEFVDRFTASLEPVLAGYQRENKRHATVAVGCTGGKHRSVVLAQEIGQRLATHAGVVVRVKHRDLGRE